ncbi:MFS multidrug transporter [Ascosphaera apis ARSEF 7405]|uniref:MFS multidrug transporter n=1 Tax=Ascosphaera apis ARSEF 7405 TaxID=392613 RepID=A0A168AWS1_9EURO|nr:MFS multidrug transporter [Ascosphaera apis ARSEF 7405]
MADNNAVPLQEAALQQPGDSNQFPRSSDDSVTTRHDGMLTPDLKTVVSNTPKDLALAETEICYIDFHTNLPPLASPAPTELPMPDLTPYTCAMEWSTWRKVTVMIFVTYFSCYSGISAASYNSPMIELQEKWHISHVVYELGSTLFCIGFAIMPMVLAPFSELIGRRWVILGSSSVFLLCMTMCGVTNSFAGMAIARFFVGCGGSVFSSLLGGIISDIYPSEKLNTPMAALAAATLFGTGFGPLICGYIAARHSWRWVFYMQSICDGAFLVYGLFFLKESRADALLRRKAKALNSWYDKLEDAGCIGVKVPVDPEKPFAGYKTVRIRWRCKSDEQRQGLLQMICMSFYRPFHFLFTEPVVFFFSLWISFAWGILFLTFSAIPLVFGNRYGFDLEQKGAVASTMCVGTMIAFIMSVCEDKYLRKHHPEKVLMPEHRLYFACLESFFLPIGLFWFGWTCYSSVHWIVPTMAIAVATMGIFSIFLSCFNFSTDCYGHYASSVLAAQSFLRNMFGGVFSLFTREMFEKIGYSGASSLLGGVALALSLVPWALVLFGPRIRARSKICSEIMRAKGEK